ncbi:MAG: hypothetical protein WCO63_07440 [Bacteroidota bacterium]
MKTTYQRSGPNKPQASSGKKNASILWLIFVFVLLFSSRVNAQTNATGSYVTIGSQTAATYQPPSLTATTSYQRRRVSTLNGNVCYSAYTTAITITVDQPSYAPTAPVVSSLSANGSNIKWYSAASGGTLYTGTESLVHGQTYYATQTVNCRESATRLNVSKP